MLPSREWLAGPRDVSQPCLRVLGKRGKLLTTDLQHFAKVPTLSSTSGIASTHLTLETIARPTKPQPPLFPAMSKELCAACARINLYTLGAHTAYHGIWRPSLNPALARDRHELTPATCPMCRLVEDCILRDEAEEVSEGAKVTRFSFIARPNKYSQKVGFNPELGFGWRSLFTEPLQSIVISYHHRIALPRAERLAEKSIYRLRKVEEIQLEVEYDRMLNRMNNRFSQGRNYTLAGHMDIFAAPSMFPCPLGVCC